MKKCLIAVLFLTAGAHAATVNGTSTAEGNGHTLSIAMFFGIILVTLYITWWAARKVRSTGDFYNAGGNISGVQNGLAIAGDAMSAGALLGLSALVYSNGFDGLVYAVGYTTGMPIVVFLLAGPLRKLGKYTFSDVVCARLEGNGVRVFAAIASLCIVLFYLVAQMVGAGQLIQTLFGLDYLFALFLVGILMVLYVVFGGMMATTWVQIVKAILMLSGCLFLCFLIMRHYGFSYALLLRDAVATSPKGEGILTASAFSQSHLSALSLGIALMFGTAGLPHVLMRFFTVPDARAARSSVLWATILMNGFYAMIFIIGVGAICFLHRAPRFFDVHGALIGGGNSVALHLADALGGGALLGFLSAVAFATILAVVAGLTLSGASAISHDLYRCVYAKGKPTKTSELTVLRLSVVALGIVAILLALVFKNQNIAYMISLAFSISCSSTFPVLLLAIYWKRFTARGAVWGGLAGLMSSLTLTVLGPSVWVKVFGFTQPMFSIDPPALFTVPLAFLVCFTVSLREKAPVSTNNVSLQ
ncbi:sodium/solute symporter [Robbsia sp. KACC 23696]|uniref:sodium:solute symporter family transporter n=1 Tax=Robbsia sp. KACC 23696 TaxID=3149231 RepID=UPI00325C28BF